MIAAVLALAAGPVRAEIRPTGLIAQVLTDDGEGRRIYERRPADAALSPGPDLRLGPGDFQNGLDTVPVDIDLVAETGGARLTLDYRRAGAALFATGRFNGYRIALKPACLSVEGVRPAAGTTLPDLEDRLGHAGGALSIDMSGLAVGPDDRIVLDLAVDGCPTS